MHKKCWPAIDTSQATGLDIALVASRNCSFDSHFERRNRSRNDNPFSTRNENLYCVIESGLYEILFYILCIARLRDL